MGQYHLLINHSKRQFINPDKIGNGLKLLEQVGWEHSTPTVLFMLLAASNGRGGGDFPEHPLIGSWAGDRISILGDYAEKDDLKRSKELISRQTDAEKLSDKIRNRGGYKDISDKVRKMMEVCYNVEYSGEGWMDIKESGRG